ncbi:MAG: DinB family protein [Bacteroidota bacterium]|nr:DinB family protein [Bacteroidota bacterium]
MLSKSEIVAGEFYHRYIQNIEEGDINKNLKKNTRQFKKFLKEIPRKKVDRAYAEGKWTIREILQHLIDAERVFSYRALRFARKDGTPLPGFDENTWARTAGAAGRRSWDDLQEEFRAVRKSTEALFASMNDDQLQFVGEASGTAQNALALAYLIPGHVVHHIRVIKERYL